MMVEDVAHHKHLFTEQSQVELQIQRAQWNEREAELLSEVERLTAAAEAERNAAAKNSDELAEQHREALQERQSAHDESLGDAEHKCSETRAQLSALRSYLAQYAARLTRDISEDNRNGDAYSSGSEQSDAEVQRVVEPESAELTSRLEAFAQDLSVFVKKKAQEARAAHTRYEQLRDALEAQLEAHALEIEAHQAERVAAREQHAEQVRLTSTFSLATHSLIQI